MNPNDEIRHKILRYFYDRNASATSRQGKEGSAVKISVAKWLAAAAVRRKGAA
jgi:hypothetical protein